MVKVGEFKGKTNVISWQKLLIIFSPKKGVKKFTFHSKTNKFVCTTLAQLLILLILNFNYYYLLLILNDTFSSVNFRSVMLPLCCHYY